MKTERPAEYVVAFSFVIIAALSAAMGLFCHLAWRALMAAWRAFT